MIRKPKLAIDTTQKQPDMIQHPNSDCIHPPPRRHVLLLSCMDRRLLDNTVVFMNNYNLINRYDQVVFAGAALGVMQLGSSPVDGDPVARHSAWKDVFFHHLKIAIDDLERKIKDVFILEHRDCGAYEHFHPYHRQPYCEDDAGQNLEKQHHCEQAFLLASAIRDYCQEQYNQSKHVYETTRCGEERFRAKKRMEAWQDIRVKCFLMDLLGNVEHLCETDSAQCC